jgi:hypothetical protein
MKTNYEKLTDTELQNELKKLERQVIILHNKQMSIKILKHS